MAEEFTIDAVAGEVDIDVGSVQDAVRVGEIVVGLDFVVVEAEEAGDVGQIKIRADIVSAKSKVATIVALGLRLEE